MVDKKVLVAVGAVAVGTALVGLAMRGGQRKQTNFKIGDTLVLTALEFSYKGRATKLYVNWGIGLLGSDPSSASPKSGKGLAVGQASYGGPIDVALANDWVDYRLNPTKLGRQPLYLLSKGLIGPGRYDLIAWLTENSPSTEDSRVIGLEVVPGGIVIAGAATPN